MNDNAEFLSTICLENKLIVLNNLKTVNRHFLSSKAYRKRDVWISELDTCIVTPELVKCVADFAVIKEADMPSDHAPISVTLGSPRVCLDNVLTRASMLGDHAVLHGNAAKCNVVRKPIRFGEIVTERFEESISSVNVPDVNVCSDVNLFATNVSDVFYDCAERSCVRQAPGDLNLGRWERLLRDTDDARVWKATSWKGDFGADKNEEHSTCPSDEEFKVHFERVLNPTTTPPPLYVNTVVTIPVLDDPISPLEVESQIESR